MQTRPRKLSLREVAENYGYDDTMELLEAASSDSVVPSLCEDGCEVEPDGRCEHGYPSVLLAAGLI